VQDNQDPWARLLVTLISAAGMAASVWLTLPESERLMIRLTVRAWLHRNLHRSARRAGRAGMGAELHDHAPTAAVSYGLAYRLSRWRDTL
jgi:hypothetical protein